MGEGIMKPLTKILSSVLILVLVLSTVVTAYEIPEPTDYGNGVLYFESNNYPSGIWEDSGVPFGQSLSYYLGQHPNQTVVSIVADAGLSYGMTEGFYVIIKTIEPRPKLVCECNPINTSEPTSREFIYTCPTSFIEPAGVGI